MPNTAELTRCFVALYEAASAWDRTRAVKALERQFADWFQRQGAEILDRLPIIKHHFAEAQTQMRRTFPTWASFAEADVGAFMEVSLPSLDGLIDDALEVTRDEGLAFAQGGVLNGYTAGYEDLDNNLGLSNAFNMSDPKAIKWAEERAGRTISQVNKTTKKRVRQLVEYGLAEGDSYGEVGRSIKALTDDFAGRGTAPRHIRSRAELIAVTEMGEAYEAGQSQLISDIESVGVPMLKRRAGPNDDRTSDACKEDLAAGWIPNDEEFPSGIMSGLEHPGCRHSTGYRVADLPEDLPDEVRDIFDAPAAKKAVSAPQAAKQAPGGVQSARMPNWSEMTPAEMRGAIKMADDIMSDEAAKYAAHLKAGLDPDDFDWSEWKRAQKLFGRKPTNLAVDMMSDEEWLWLRDLTDEEYQILRDWQAGYSTNLRLAQAGRMDEALAKLQDLKPGATMDDLELNLSRFESALAKAPKQQYDEVYRGLYNISDDAMEAMSQVDDVVRMQATGSMTKDLDAARAFSLGKADDGHAVILRLQNADGVDMRSISGKAFIDEMEVLAPRGSKYRVLSFEDVRDEIYGTKVRYINLQQVSDDYLVNLHLPVAKAAKVAEEVVDVADDYMLSLLRDTVETKAAGKGAYAAVDDLLDDLMLEDMRSMLRAAGKPVSSEDTYAVVRKKVHDLADELLPESMAADDIAASVLSLTDDEVAWAEGVSGHRLDAVHEWQGAAHADIRDVEKFNPHVLTQDHYMEPKFVRARLFNEVLDDAPKYEGTVYRGLHDLSDDTLDALMSVDEITMQSSGSASKSLEVASTFAEGGEDEGFRLMLEVRTKTGVDLRAVSMREYVHEQEVVLRAGSRYKVIAREHMDVGDQIVDLLRLEEIDEVLDDVGRWAKDLSDEAKDALAEWQGTNWHDIKAASAGKLDEIAASRRAAAVRKAEVLEDALDDAPKFEGIVYRGMENLDDDALEALIGQGKGHVIKMDSLTSASTRKEVGQEFASLGLGDEGTTAVEMKIASKSGVRLGPAATDEWADQAEVILRANSKYEIRRVGNVMRQGDGTDIVEIWLQEIDDAEYAAALVKQKTYGQPMLDKFVSVDDTDEVLQATRAMRDSEYLTDIVDEYYGTSAYTADEGDVLLKKLMKDRGFDKPTRVVGQDEFQEAVRRGDYVLFRGTSAKGEVKQARVDKAVEWAEQFKTGDMRVGTGSYGNGHYATYGNAGDGLSVHHTISSQRSVATGYADNIDEAVTAMTMPRDAKVVTFEDLQDAIERAIKIVDEMQAMADQVEAEEGMSGLSYVNEIRHRADMLATMVQEEGRFATMLGYDAIAVPQQGYMVVLNRSALSSLNVPAAELSDETLTIAERVLEQSRILARMAKGQGPL